MIASARLARQAVSALLAAGVTHVIVCPGSRSAPLAYALDAAARRNGRPVLLVRHDERSAAFVALGIGRAGGLAAVVTTSGTAAANLHPAVLEAHHGGVPMVVVTADRPPHLRRTWANQTSDLQSLLFGTAVRASVDLADSAEGSGPDDGVRDVLERAVAAAWGGLGVRPGPVQLNLGFSDPLVPDDDPGPDARPQPDAGPVTGAARARQAVAELPPGPRTVVVAGDGAGPQARALAEAAGWPLLAEPSSGARSGPAVVDGYRLLLELPELAGAVQRVVAFGRPTLSRPVTRLLDRADVELVLVSPYPHWPQPGRPVTRAGAVTAAPGDAAWGRRWQVASAAARRAMDAVLADRPLSGPLVAHRLAATLRPGQVLVAAASNPIRDLDLAAAPFPDGVSVHANRGLSGIDGTVSTGLGVALAGSGYGAGPVRLLVGDLAFLHDANALLAEPGSSRPPLQVVLLNDGGGGIFSLLEHGARALTGPDQDRTFERMFAAPQDVDLAGLSAAYGVAHHRVDGPADLVARLAEPPAGTSVLEVGTSRADLRDLHAELRAAVHSAAGAALGHLAG